MLRSPTWCVHQRDHSFASVCQKCYPDLLRHAHFWADLLNIHVKNTHASKLSTSHLEALDACAPLLTLGSADTAAGHCLACACTCEAAWTASTSTPWPVNSSRTSASGCYARSMACAGTRARMHVPVHRSVNILTAWLCNHDCVKRRNHDIQQRVRSFPQLLVSRAPVAVACTAGGQLRLGSNGVLNILRKQSLRPSLVFWPSFHCAHQKD